MNNRLASCLLLTAILQARALAQQPPVSSACPVSTDATYGYTITNPVRIGGGAMYVAAREQRYLNALRGPAGQRIVFKRSGSLPDKTNSATILDLYVVTYDGLETPLNMYLDVYHFEPQFAPQGLVCGDKLTLSPPPIDGFKETDAMQALAVEQAEKDLPAISLDPDGSGLHGVMFDRYRMMSKMARVAAAGGQPLDPSKPIRAGSLIVAYPLNCEGKTIAPTGIEIVPPQGQAPPRDGDYRSGDAIRQLLPGVEIPASSLAAAFGLGQLRPNDSVKITYADACTGSNSVTLTAVHTPSKALKTAPARFPLGTPPMPAQIWVQAIVHPDGTLQRPVYLGGPEQLLPPALETLAEWRAEPARVNGAPIVTSTVAVLTFR
jgi:hypothetical protein